MPARSRPAARAFPHGGRGQEVAHVLARKSKAKSKFITAKDGLIRHVESVRFDGLELAGSWFRKRTAEAFALEDQGRDAP